MAVKWIDLHSAALELTGMSFVTMFVTSREFTVLPIAARCKFL